MANKKSNKTKAKTTTPKKTSEVKKVEEENVVTEIVDESKKELDEMVAAMKKDAAKANGAKKSADSAKKGGMGWGTFFILLVLIGLLGWGAFYAYEQMQAQKIKASLPTVIGYLGGEMKLKEIQSFKAKGGVFEFKFTFEEYPDEPFTSYISKDGKTFFVEGYDVEQLKQENEAAGTDPATGEAANPSPATAAEVSKNPSPELTAYIVSDCPYGKQMQSVMLDALSQVPAIKDNFQVRYFFTEISDDGKNVVAMHGPEEGVENMRQICIREEQKPVYWDYVKCYAEGAASDSCLVSAKVDKAKVEACMADPARGVKFAKADDAMAVKNNITGSPTLILNETDTIQESKFGGRNAQGLKNIVCASADNALPFCEETLNTETAAASGNC